MSFKRYLSDNSLYVSNSAVFLNVVFNMLIMISEMVLFYMAGCTYGLKFHVFRVFCKGVIG